MANEIGLGVLFYGKVTGLLTEISKLEQRISKLNRRFATFNKGMAAVGSTTKKTADVTKGMTHELSEYSKWVGNASNQTKRYRTAQAEMTKASGKSSGALKNATAQLNRADKAIYNHAQNMKASNAVKKRFYERTSRLAVMEREAAGTLKLTSKGLERVAATTEKASAATKKANVGTKKHSNTMIGYNKQIAKVEGGMNRLYAAMKVTASYGIAASAIFMVVNAFKAGVAEIVNYDQALKNLQAISGGTSTEISAMGGTIKNVANTTKFSTTEIADGMVLLAQSGLTAAESMAAIQATANLATGTLSSLESTADLLTTSIRAYGLEASEAGRVSDVMANAVNKSKLTIDKLRVSFNYVAAIAAESGLSIEQTAASMMVLANSGVRASTIGTGLRQVLSKLIAPNAKLRESYEKHGIALDKVNPSVVGYEKALENLSAVLWDTEKGTVDTAKAFDLFKLRGAQAAAVLVRSFVSGAYNKALDNAKEVGTAFDMAGTQAKGLGVKIKNLMDKFGLLAVALGEAGVTGALNSIVDILRDLVESITSFISGPLGTFILKWGALTAAISMAAFAVSKFLGINLIAGIIAQTTALGGLTVATNVLWTAWSKLTLLMAAHPFVAIGLAIGGVIAFVTAWGNENEKLTKTLEKQIAFNDKTTISLTRYIDSLKLLKEAMDRSENVSVKYESTLLRLIKEHPQLSEIVLENKSDFDKLIGSLEKYNSELEKTQIDLYINKLKLNAEKLEDLSRKEKDYTLLIKAGLPETENLVATQEALLEARRDELQIMDLLSGKYTDLITTNQRTKESVFEEIDARVQSNELLEETANLIKTNVIVALDELIAKQKQFTGETKKHCEEMPGTWKTVYEELDALGKVAIVEETKRLEKRIAAYKETAEVMLANGIMTEKELAEGVEAIRQESLEKLQEQLEKRLEDQLTALQKSGLSEKEIIEGTTQIYIAHYENLLARANEHYEKKVSLVKTANEAQIEIIKSQPIEEDKKNQKIEQLTKALHIKLQTFRHDRMMAYKLMINALVSEENRLLDAIKASNAEKLRIEQNTLDMVRDLKQKLMTDEQKWNDDRNKTNELYAKGVDEMNKSNYESAKKYFEESQTAAAGLAREVTDGQETVSTEARNTATAIELVEKAGEAAAGAEEKYFDTLSSSLGKVRLILDETRDKLDQYIAAIDAANQRKLTLDTASAHASLDALVAALDAFEAKNYDKTITITKKTVFVGEGSSVKPLTEKTKEMEGVIQSFSDKVNDTKTTATVKFEGEGSDTKPVTEKIKEVESLWGKVGWKLQSEMVPVLSVDSEPALSAIEAAIAKYETFVQNAIRGMTKYASDSHVWLFSQLKKRREALEREVKTLQKYYDENPLMIVTNFTGTGSATLPLSEKIDKMTSKVKSFISMVNSSTATLTANFKLNDFDKKQFGGEIKMQGGGGVPGFGSGDTVPAMLEPGEFVEPKSTVKEYGGRFFEALRHKLIPKEMIQSLLAGIKMKTGGAVRAVRPQVQKLQAGGQVQSRETLYTVNLNLNKQSHELYGEKEVINSFVKNLRRSQLVTI